MAISLCRLALFISLLLLGLSVLALAFVERDAPGFVPALLSVGMNLVTAVGSGACVYRLARKKR